MSATELLPSGFGGFDPVDLDMIQRGDMLGPRLGQKVFAALQQALAERDEARRELFQLKIERDDLRDALDATFPNGDPSGDIPL